MSLHGWVTGVMAVGMLGLAALVVTGPQPSESAREAGGDERTDERIERLESRLDDALRKLSSRSRVGRIDTAETLGENADPAEIAAAAAGDEPPTDATDASVAARLDALEAKLDLVAVSAGVDLTDPTTLSTEELTKRANQATASNRGKARGVAGYKMEETFWRELLSRNLTDEERHKAQYGLGIALRGQKRHDEEAAVFEDMIVRAGGIDTEEGVSAGFQLAWARVYSDDNAASLRAFDSVANSSAVSPVLRVHSLLRAGENAMRTNEPDRAREYFRRLLEDHREDIPESQPWLVTNAEQRLRELDAN